MNLTCTDLEILLADYLDSTLPAEQRTAIASHLESCNACREFANDVAGAVAFIGRSADIEPPPALIQRILADAHIAAPQSWLERFFRNWLAPVLQPRVAMGFAMTVLSVAMIGQSVKAMKLDPARVWTFAENRVYRLWDRTVKNAENLNIVAQVQSQWDELNDDSSNGAQNR